MIMFHVNLQGCTISRVIHPRWCSPDFWTINSITFQALLLENLCDMAFPLDMSSFQFPQIRVPSTTFVYNETCGGEYRIWFNIALEKNQVEIGHHFDHLDFRVMTLDTWRMRFGWFIGKMHENPLKKVPQAALLKGIYPINTQYIRCIWGWLLRGSHPNNPISLWMMLHDAPGVSYFILNVQVLWSSRFHRANDTWKSVQKDLDTGRQLKGSLKLATWEVWKVKLMFFIHICIICINKI